MKTFTQFAEAAEKKKDEKKKETGPDFKSLKSRKVPLDADERAECMRCKAVWHNGPSHQTIPAVWKSVDGTKVTFVTNTHRAFATADSLKGAIEKYHKQIKATA